MAMIGEAWLDQQSPVFWSERLRWALPKVWNIGLVATEYLAGQLVIYY